MARLGSLAIALFAWAFILFAPIAHADGYYQLRYTFGGPGSAPGQTGSLNAIVQASSGTLDVADAANSHIEILDPWGHYRITCLGPGSGDGQFLDGPVDLAVGYTAGYRNSYLYAVDRGNCRIQMLEPLDAVSGVDSLGFFSAWGSYGTGPGQFLSPSNIAVDGNGFVYVGDPVANRIQKFTANGVYVTGWGSYGNGDGQFLCNAGITIDPAGQIEVADRCQGRVQVFTANGVFVGAWGAPGSGDGQLMGPVKVAFMGGMIFVAEQDGNRVQQFNGSHVYVRSVGTPGTFAGPTSVIMPPDDNIVWVADAGHGVVKGFTFIGTGGDPTPTKPSTWGRLKAMYR